MTRPQGLLAIAFLGLLAVAGLSLWMKPPRDGIVENIRQPDPEGPVEISETVEIPLSEYLGERRKSAAGPAEPTRPVQNIKQSAKEIKAAKIPAKIRAVIRDLCADKWSGNHSMKEKCEEKQYDAFNYITEPKPGGITTAEYDAIMNYCFSAWKTDFEKIASCQRRQLEAWR